MEHLFGRFSKISSDIIFFEKSYINKHARRWILLFLLDSQNLYNNPPGIPIFGGLLITFPKIILDANDDKNNDNNSNNRNYSYADIPRAERPIT